MNYFNDDPKSAHESKALAQFIAFAPVVFQASRLLRKFGILSLVKDSGARGMSLDELEEKVDLPRYGIKVLSEIGLGIGLLLYKDDRFVLTKTGYFILQDDMTGVNIDFTHDVCYQGMFHLEEAVKTGRPTGLKGFGKWSTIYESLSALPKRVQESWFNFDHYYSDLAFPVALPHVFKERPRRLLDVGGNTGKWALQCVAYDADVSVTILDLPGQVAMATETIKSKGLGHRVTTHEMNILNPESAFPKGFDAIWMSQFLDCFSLAEITDILKRASASMEDGASLFILETYWDRQQNESSAFCLQATSLYFTCMANGNSQMYHSDDMKRCLSEAGLEVVEDVDCIGPYHTLFRCRKAR